MVARESISSRVQFGLFEADLQTGELWKAGHRVKLQGQPFRALSALIERPGEVISREELQERLWGRQASGDFDQSIGTAINKVREALGDSADNPRFVETLARRGYRFIAPVTVIKHGFAEEAAPVLVTPVMQHLAVPAAAELQTVSETEIHPVAQPMAPLPVSPVQGRFSSRLPMRLASAAILGVAVILIGALAGYLLGRRQTAAPPLRVERLTHTGRIAPGVESMESLPSSVTDGLRIFTTVISGGRAVMAQVDSHSGEVQRFNMPSDIAAPMLGDISPDGASLLLRSHLSPESEQPLWVVPTSGGSALRLSDIIAHDATWMPDSKGVLFAAGNQLFIHQPQDEPSRLFATVPGRAFWMRWSPDGSLLRFTLLNPVDHTLGLWEIDRNGGHLRPLLAGWTDPPAQCCGAWTGDGKYFIFQSDVKGSSDLWRLNGKSLSDPVRITNGPLSFVAPTTSRTGHRIYFIGLETQSALLSFDPARKVFMPEQDFLADANRIEYSRDLKWVIWTDQHGRLWRARADGSERIQVTPDSMEVFLAHWSPAGDRVALMAREPGKAWKLYTVPPDGGTPVRLLTESRNEADPSWSPDGQQIVFGRVTDMMGKEEGQRNLEIVSLKTGQVSAVPQSEGLFSPRWSPDGRYIAAISLDQLKLMLLDVQTQTWSTLATTTVADPVWSADSRSIVFHADRAETQPIYRVFLEGKRLELMASLASFVGGNTEDYFFCGLTPDGRPIVRSRTGTGDVYSVDLEDARK